MATLYRLGKNGFGAEQWDIDEQPVVVGRSGQAGVTIADEGMSRRHFLITRDGDSYVIKDLNSRNGTWVDGRRIFAEKLHHNERISAGNNLFLFAEMPVSTAPERRGPHDTVVVSGAKQVESLSASRSWQEEAGSSDFQVAA